MLNRDLARSLVYFSHLAFAHRCGSGCRYRTTTSVGLCCNTCSWHKTDHWEKTKENAPLHQVLLCYLPTHPGIKVIGLQTREVERARSGELPDQLASFPSLEAHFIRVSVLHLGEFLHERRVLAQFLDGTARRQIRHRATASRIRSAQARRLRQRKAELHNSREPRCSNELAAA